MKRSEIHRKPLVGGSYSRQDARNLSCGTGRAGLVRRRAGDPAVCVALLGGRSSEQVTRGRRPGLFHWFGAGRKGAVTACLVSRRVVGAGLR